MTNYEKLAALENNVEFKQKLAAAATPEEARDVLMQYGVELSVHEVNEMIREAEGELSDADLDTVAGGCIGRRIVGYKIVWIRVPPRWIPVPVLVPIYR